MLLDIIRDGLGDELTTDEIARRELALDKEIIQLIQSACKADKLARAIDLIKLLHHTASFDMAIKVAQFYHLLGLQEKMEMLKDEREDNDRLEGAREKRRERVRDLAAVPAMRQHAAEAPSRPKAFQDFRPPPAIHRPGLERVQTNGAAGPSKPSASSSNINTQSTAYESTFVTDDSQFAENEYAVDPSPDGKRKRSEERESSACAESGAKRQAFGESASGAGAAPPARKLFGSVSTSRKLIGSFA